MIRATDAASSVSSANWQRLRGLHFPHDKPAAPEQAANWLPAPKDDFIVMMRLYWPETNKPSILDGTWAPPGLSRAPETHAMGGAEPGPCEPGP